MASIPCNLIKEIKNFIVCHSLLSFSVLDRSYIYSFHRYDCVKNINSCFLMCSIFAERKKGRNKQSRELMSPAFINALG